MTVTRSMAGLTLEKVAELLDEKLDAKLSILKKELKEEFSTALIDEIKKEIKEEVGKIVETQSQKIVELESHVEILSKHVDVLKKQISITEGNTEELEQYGRRLCLRVDGMATAENETPNQVLEKLRSYWDGVVEIPDCVVDRAHRIGSKYKDRNTGVEKQGVIVRFTTFRHRSNVYYAKKRNDEKIWCLFQTRLDKESLSAVN